ncbi:methyltransferase, TIGR00027 family [Actinacidiphila alni]|uniref:S-adenosyl-L-methionine-dependent methyltransferase n=1 Tax=Actinacidiphila alni TaxID=380248 RepID=A0A1I1XMC4_9ACTN|nr:class I SAM-dependent methyltransferase [Actinacidiphila alni]SFE08512.1 methyltransferase, TIGR00027 family [Actinacidiphila alni]
MDGPDLGTGAPDSTAVRVALWRAVHLLSDPPPHVLEDGIGLRLADPEDGWRQRGDMDPDGTSRYRAGVLARARFIEDLVLERLAAGVGQYVLLGAGLDTFAQRRPDLADRLRVFEVDRPEPQEWKRRRLADLGLDAPGRPTFVPVDFEGADSWWDRLVAAGFDPARPAVVASAGVSMYLTHEANAATLRTLSALAPGSTVVMTFQPPLGLLPPAERAVRAAAERGARASGTPFITFYSPAEALTLARTAGFPDAHHVSATALNERYFAGRTDGLRTSSGEELLVAGV